MSRSVRDLLADPLKGTNRAQGILCYLFRHVLLWRNVNLFSWNRRTTIYFKKPHNQDNPDKGNLNKALTTDDFTWSTFKKAVDFLNPVSAVLIITLTWRAGHKSEYSIVIDPAEAEDDLSLNTFSDLPLESDVFAEQKQPTNTLARLYRQIIVRERIDVTRWNALLEKYVKNPLNGVAQNQKEQATAISAFQRELFHPRMSWNVFRRGILLLNPVEEEYRLKLRWGKGGKEVSEHFVTIRDPLDLSND